LGGAQMESVLLIVYLLIGFSIARSMKDDKAFDSTGAERLAWFLAWPILFIRDFITWIINTFEDD
jgi:hypothetical protein